MSLIATCKAVNEVPAVPVVGTCVNASLLAADALITMLPVVAGVIPPVAMKVYVPDVFRVRVLNVATPFTALAVSVQPVARLVVGPLLTAIVTVEVFDVTKLP